ncbi:KPN_02809 family neutral zinc metallopeptidase [Nigerium massiliense]|uniref:KPN_02809 family neutral zinc metallopeptidase n=1 Tax=Nigerium massiliense TaxID=1522317 RepID=UPI00058E2230|nr:neutral zinc metallopeptidase [Nigerium massiliense]
MQYNSGAQLDPSQMGGGGGGGRIAVGGGVGLIVVLLALFLGIDPGVILGGAQQGQQPSGRGSAPNPYAHCTSGASIEQDRNCRFVAYTNSVQGYWSQAMGQNYQRATTKTFDSQISTGCGTATSQVGPFYCPNDMTVYLDPTFFDQMLKGELGAQGGDAAEAYVIAHEYGHHVQNLTGVMEKVQSQGRQTGQNSAGVALELQADCYAGVWLKHATDDPHSVITSITQDDLNRAIDAAVSVGDDRIQRKSGGGVNPDAWTHGSSAQRKKWTATGFSTGDPQRCNTFGSGA